jgi:hypothetical protein
VGLTTLPPSCADCLEIWEPQPSGTLRACTGRALPLDEGIPHLMLSEFIPVAVINGNLCKVARFLEFVYGLVLKKIKSLKQSLFRTQLLYGLCRVCLYIRTYDPGLSVQDTENMQ